MRGILITGDIARAIEEQLGTDFETIQREADERRAAAALAAEEAKRLRAEEREQRRQELRWQVFADELGERVRVEINGKEIKSAGKVTCPHCGSVPAGLLRISCNAGTFLLATDWHRVSPFQAMDWPGTDRRWRIAPHIEAPIECECGGDFDLSITVLP